jgi:hypothetical protein
MTKNEKKAAKTAALLVFKTVTVANWSDAELAKHVDNYSICSPRHPGRRIVEAAAKARNLI